MNISKNSIRYKLYKSFAIVLAMVLLIFIVNYWAMQREHGTKEASAQAKTLKEATGKIRFQMMQNRLNLGNYLLSGDTREIEHMNEGVHKLADILQNSFTLTTSEQIKDDLNRVLSSEQNWARDFAEPLVQKRKDVDSGNATVAELQIFYLQKDAAAWVKTATDLLDKVDLEIENILTERRKSDEFAGTITTVVSILSTLAALIVGTFIAFRTAGAITDPLTKLIEVARQIATAGDLDHEIEIRSEDEIGELGKNFSSMVTYLKEMAGVSEAIAGGNLNADVKARSKNDVLGNAFSSMTDGLRGLVRNVRDASSQVATASNQVAGASDESAKISLQTSSAIDEVTSTMHEMSVNVQNMVKSTQTQASSVSETSASIDQMVASIQRVADTAKVLLDISNRSREEVNNGIGTMDKAT